MSSVTKAISTITKAIGPLSKGVMVEGGRNGYYSVLGIDQIISAIQPHLVEQGLIIIPSVAEVATWDVDVVNSEGTVVGTKHWARVVVDYIMMVEDGTPVTARMVGESENDNDKSLSAALSMAEKYFYKQTFKIVTGDPDPDTQGTKVKEVSTVAPTQQQETGAPVRPQQQPRPPAPAPQQQQMASTVAANANQGAGGMASKSQASAVWAITHKKLQKDDPWMFDFIQQKVGVVLTNTDQLTFEQAKTVISALKKLEAIVDAGGSV